MGSRLISQVPYLANARDDGWFDLELQGNHPRSERLNLSG